MRTEGDLRSRSRSDGRYEDRVVREGRLPAFQRELAGIEAEIQAANADATRAVVYRHLLPSRVPTSIRV
jgi:hypothetical protein